MLLTSLLLISFNSHPHKEDDTSLPDRFLRTMSFNSHPHKEDDSNGATVIPASHSFNSHPHKEDDISVYVPTLVIRLSTHILTRRMTAVL